MKIILLTHERELHRKTNTGALAVKHSDGIVERVLWERTNPNKKILDLIERKEALLLYPNSDSTITDIEDFENIIVIDGTWQEAQKIVNKSPYLQTVATASLGATMESKFKLRRNQPNGGLCTIECVIELFKMKGFNKLASKLEFEFEQFNNQ